MKAEDSFTIQQWSCVGGDTNQAWQLSFFSGSGSTPEYQFINKKSGLCKGVLNDSINASTQVMMEGCTVDAGQLFSTRNTVVGNQLQTQVVSLLTGYCLDVRGGSHDNGAVVQQYPGNGTGAQIWVESSFS